MATKPILSFFVFFITALLFQGAWSAKFTFTNNCPYTVWPGVLTGGSSAAMPTTGFELQHGASQSFDSPAGWSGRIWPRSDCSSDSSGKFSCLTGDCGSGQVSCKVSCNNAGGAPPASLVELTLASSQGGQDFYDVSNVDGFNVPVKVDPQVSGCTAPACAVDIDAMCPAELQVRGPDGKVIACKSACLAFNTDQYCCRGAYGDPTKCQPSDYSKIFKNACPQAYSYAFDDKSSTFTCTGGNYLITFCP